MLNRFQCSAVHKLSFLSPLTPSSIRQSIQVWVGRRTQARRVLTELQLQQELLNLLCTSGTKAAKDWS
jgi:hypothetical protein